MSQRNTPLVLCDLGPFPRPVGITRLSFPLQINFLGVSLIYCSNTRTEQSKACLLRAWGMVFVKLPESTLLRFLSLGQNHGETPYSSPTMDFIILGSYQAYPAPSPNLHKTIPPPCHQCNEPDGDTKFSTYETH